MIKTTQPDNPFQILARFEKSRLTGQVARWVEPPVSRLSGLKRCADLYGATRAVSDQNGGLFAETALNALGVKWKVDEDSLSSIPRRDAVIVVANHPFGGLEGLVLMAMLRRIRPDVKIFANHLLWRIPELRDQMIPINPFDTRRAKRENVQPLRQSLQWLARGGLIVIFPAGEVSHFTLRSRQVEDPPWRPAAGHLARRSGATVVPVYFPGRNGVGFQIAGMVHPRLRTLLLPRQLLNKDARPLSVTVGEQITPQRIRQFDSSREISAYLRLRTYLLADEQNPACAGTLPVQATAVAAVPVPASVGPRALAAEIAELPGSCLLHEQGVNQIWCVTARQAPLLLGEIGRLRELTFRLNGEGTGRSIDLDRFDHHYQHLFVWNSREMEIVGAYRIGATDRILAGRGMNGLYTNTLFRFDVALFDRFEPALELGRSFVRPEYQRSFSALLLLWQGIGRYLVRNPHYRVLFGPVSISNEYSDLSRNLMTRTLLQQLSMPGLSRHVSPRLPVTTNRLQVKGCCRELTRMVTADVAAVDALVSDIEKDGKGIPVLLRHYLSLGGKILAFNRDPAFSDVIDGLVLVDLDATEPKVLARYMGREGCTVFLSAKREASFRQVV